MSTRVFAHAAGAALLLVLGGCFLPDEYEAEVFIGRDGSYSTAFDGKLVWIEGHLDFAQGKAKGTERAFADITAQLTRPGDEVRHLGKGLYEAGIAASGTLRSAGPPVAVPSEAAKFLAIAREGRMVTLASVFFDPRRLSELRQARLASRGTLCVTTDAHVVEHNADSAPGAESDCYLWTFEDLLAQPKTVRFVIEVDGKATGAAP